jgi:hypothetical protein
MVKSPNISQSINHYIITSFYIRIRGYLETHPETISIGYNLGNIWVKIVH